MHQTIRPSPFQWSFGSENWIPPKKSHGKKNHQFSHSRSHHLTIGFNPSHVAMFAGLVWGCREVPTFRSCGWSHFFCPNFGNQRRKGIGFPTILDSSSRKWPLTEKMGKLISYLVGYTYQLRCIDQDVAVLRFSSDIPSVYIYMHMHMHM